MNFSFRDFESHYLTLCMNFNLLPLQNVFFFIQVDEDLRHKAKQLCYGILYGMGNRTLSQHLNVTELEAAYFMDMFYKTYPSIKVFTASLIEECRKKGYVETLMKRRRYLPNINSSVPSKRSEFL